MDFTGISLIIVFAALSGVLARLLRLPLLVGYLLAGVMAVFTGIIPDSHSIEGLAKIGVALLLFLVGLEMNIKELPQIGKVSVLIGIGQIAFSFGLGWLVGLAMGFDTLASIYLALATSFSSTIIVIKLLSERTDINTLYGKISLGVLLVQDFVAVLVLMMLAGVEQGGGLSLLQFVLILAKAVALFAMTLIISKNIIPYVFEKFFSQNLELLFVASLAWALGFATMVGGPLGLSLEIGGFLAGLALSGLHENLQIASRLRPLRDFFLTIFFVFLGTQLLVDDLLSVLTPAFVFSFLVLVGKPLIVTVLMGILGYRKKTFAFTGFTLAQISEFSLILTSLGVAVGHVTNREVAIVILVAIITMTSSSYVILGADTLFNRLKRLFTLFERKMENEIQLGPGEEELNDHIVLVGADRTGGSLITLLKKNYKNNVLVVDFNSAVVNKLRRNKIKAIFGDISDPEIIDAVDLADASMVISTISRPIDNGFLLKEMVNKKSKAATIFTAKSVREAKEYYKLGVDYVILPETTAGEHIRHLIRSHGITSNHFHKLGKFHSKRLNKLLT